MNDLIPTEIGKIEPRTYMENSIWVLDVVLDLFEKYGPVGSYKRMVDACLSCAKKTDELKNLYLGISDIYGVFPEFDQLSANQYGTELNATESDKKCINFLASYTPWPYPLNPKWFEIYIDALDRFKGDCKSTGFSDLYSREFCRRYLPDMPESLLRMVTGEDQVDRFGIFLKYKEAMKLGERETLILDTQIKILRALTSQKKKFGYRLACRLSVTSNLFDLLKINCSLAEVTQEPWFVECLRHEGVSLEELNSKI